MPHMQKAAIEKVITKLDHTDVTHMMPNVRIASKTAEHALVPVRPLPVHSRHAAETAERPLLTKSDIRHTAGYV